MTRPVPPETWCATCWPDDLGRRRIQGELARLPSDESVAGWGLSCGQTLFSAVAVAVAVSDSTSETISSVMVLPSRDSGVKAAR